MAVVITTLAITSALTLGRTILVIDAVFSGRGTGVVARTAQIIRSHTSQAPGRSFVESPRHQGKGGSRPGGSKARSLHLKLLAMHATAFIAMGGALLKYALPVSETSCRVNDQIMIIFTVFYDASLVTFLLAKVDVINANRTPACWEKGVVWLSRAYAWIYLSNPFVGGVVSRPLAAVAVGLAYPDGMNEEGTFCTNSFDSSSTTSNASGYASNNGLLTVQFILLLVIFVRPMLVHQEGTQSGGAVYRRVVMRNIVCTSAICIAYLITTVIMVLALLKETPEDNKASQVVDGVARVNMLVTLCMTEIALPLGFTSCWKVIAADSAKAQAGEVNRTAATAVAARTITTTPKVVPVEEQPLQTPA